MNEGEALLRAIVEAPFDDVPRLVLADWLEEHGKGERSEFIRVQVELATWPHGQGLHPRNAHYDALRRRGRALLEAHTFRPVADAVAALFGLTGKFGTDHGRAGGQGGIRWEWRRGFVSSVALKCADWLEHGPRIVACAPVTEVVLSDRVPMPLGPESEPEERAWWRHRDWCAECTAEDLPAPIFDLLPPLNLGPRWRTYNTEAAALSALSQAAVSLARAQANLPALAWP